VEMDCLFESIWVGEADDRLACTDVICSVVASMSTGELHERLYAPFSQARSALWRVVELQALARRAL
jgi:hypothetical protein